MNENRKWLASESAPKRFRRRIVGGAVLALALLVFVGLYSVVRAADGKCPNRLPFCFSAKSPAMASEVNHNFSQLLEWLEQKVGPVGSANVATTGTLSVSGTLTTNADIVSSQADGQLGITKDFALRDTGKTELRLTKGAGSEDPADLAVGRFTQVAADNKTVVSPRLIFKASYSTSTPTRSIAKISEAEIIDYCGDEDGCRITLIMRNFVQDGKLADAASGPHYFHYNKDSKQYRVENFASGNPDVYRLEPGTNNNGAKEHVMKAWDCYLTDALFKVGTSESADNEPDFYLLNWAENYQADCVLLIDD